MKLNRICLLGASLVAASLGLSSCADKLDLAPIDYYGSGNYWKKEAHLTAYVNGMHSNLRNLAWQRTINLGELRAGLYMVGAGADGSSLSSGDIIEQKLAEDRPGLTNFAGFYGPILNINLFLQELEKVEAPEAMKNYYKGQAYGIRALYYFDLYRTYGGVPIRLTPDVVNGELDVNKLRMERANPSAVMAQIKSDIEKSLEAFGTNQTFDAYAAGGNKSYWNKAATETLKGEVYLWNAKVTIGDQAATPSDADIAKQALENVLNNYGLSLQTSFDQIFNLQRRGNSEIIFVSRFLDGEAQSSGFASYLYRSDQGTVKDMFRANGTVFGDALEVKGTGILRYQYKNALYNMFDANDQRRDITFYPAYRDNQAQELVVALPRKFMGEINAQGNRVYTSDIIHYRLADVILMLAEVANLKGDNANVKRYIDMIRERAYTAAVFSATPSLAYTPSDFKTNELAILKERTKEFVQEGKRWYDLLRMRTEQTGGDALVFSAEATIDSSTAPTLPANEAYKVLWPIEKGLLTNDTKLTQTPGY